MSNPNVYSKSGSNFINVENMSSQTKQMASYIILALPGAKASAVVLFKEFGFLKGLWILFRTIWYFLFRRPNWHPEKFEFKNEKEQDLFKLTFIGLSFFIIIFRILKKKYGESKADEITGKMAIPVALPYLLHTFKPGTKINNIDEIRQLLADYLGDGTGFEWTEKISEDGTEVRYHFTKCVYGMILRAYGMKSFAGYSCLADHIVMDNVISDIVFGRKHSIGVGDTFCDHMFRMKTSKDVEKDESNYEDCYKVSFGGRNVVRHWEEKYKKNGGKFKF